MPSLKTTIRHNPKWVDTRVYSCVLVSYRDALFAQVSAKLLDTLDRASDRLEGCSVILGNYCVPVDYDGAMRLSVDAIGFILLLEVEDAIVRTGYKPLKIDSWVNQHPTAIQVFEDALEAWQIEPE